MKRGFLFGPQGSFGFILYGFLISSIIIGLSGCGTSPTTVEIPIVICTPQSPVNVYRSAPQPWGNIIFEFAFPPSATPIQFNEQQILIARNAAFQKLKEETERWSNIQTVKLDDSNEATITLTHLSPTLLQAILLNEVLKNRFPTFGFQDELQKMMNKVAEREELLFLLTVTMTNNGVNPAQHTIRIPIENMVMTNSANIVIDPSHDDHNLKLHMDALSKPVFGYLAFPLAQASADQCEWILDPKFNKNIVMGVPFIEVDHVNNQRPVSWTIPYAPLIDVVTPSNTPNLNLSISIDPTVMMPLALPPTDINQNNYWEGFARYVWNQVTLGN